MGHGNGDDRGWRVNRRAESVSAVRARRVPRTSAQRLCGAILQKMTVRQVADANLSSPNLDRRAPCAWPLRSRKPALGLFLRAARTKESLISTIAVPPALRHQLCTAHPELAGRRPRDG